MDIPKEIIEDISARTGHSVGVVKHILRSGLPALRAHLANSTLDDRARLGITTKS